MFESLLCARYYTLGLPCYLIQHEWITFLETGEAGKSRHFCPIRAVLYRSETERKGVDMHLLFPFEKKVTLCLFCWEFCHYFSLILICSNFDSLMRNHEKECPYQSEGVQRCRPHFMFCLSLLPAPALGLSQVQLWSNHFS